MAHPKRPIHGPDARTERPETYRPVRVGFERWGEFFLGEPSAFVLGGAALACLGAPALIPALLPAGLAYAGAVLARRTCLPLRLPASAKRLDPGHLLPGRKGIRRSAGTFYLGTDAQSGQEIWLAPTDATEHLSASGGTGSGKSVMLLGWCANALAQGSGFLFVDGKGDANLAALVMALCRRAGRETDFRVVNFMVASGDKDSGSFNPFQWASADAIREMLVAQVSDTGAASDGGNGAVFMDGARSLLGALAPILVWLREHWGLRIDIHTIAEATEFDVVTAVAYDRVFNARDHRTGKVAALDLAGMPEALVSPIRAYLGERGGYDEDLHRGRRQSDEPARQHSFVKLYFSAAFNQMRVSLGHIFGAGSSDIDMRDVVINRRVLLVRLPALENSGRTTAALGKLVVAALRGTMAEALGGRLEGHYDDLVANRPTAAPTPYVVCLDELAAFAAPGNDLILQQARELNFSVALGWHDVEGLESRIGGAAGTLLNNTTTSVWMRQNAGGKTRALLESSVGDADVTQLTRYDTNGGGVPTEARSVEVRRTVRVDWKDTREQEAGEAIVVRGNRRVYARLFHAAVDPRGPMRLNRPVRLDPPAPEECRAAGEALDGVRAALGAPLPRKAPDAPPDYLALVAGLRTAEAAGIERRAAAEAAVLAVGAAPYLPRPVPQPADAPPRTAFAPAFAPAAEATEPNPTPAAAPVPDHAGTLAEDLAAIERMLGADPAEAARRARRAVAEREAALDPARLPQPPAMDPDDLRALLRDVIRDFGGDPG